MTEDILAKEIFYFQPSECGFCDENVESVHLLGEFNNWGNDKEKLENYNLFKDRTGRWVGVFEVKAGREPYKFLINYNTYFPDIGEKYYSTVKTCKWARKALWYQIFPDRFYKSTEKENTLEWGERPDYYNHFGGDLNGIEEKIDYLKTLFGSLEDVGIYLNPITVSSASNHKYWTENFNEIDPDFGTKADLKKLIKSLHNENAKIILDLAFNHTGLNHPAFLDILENGVNSKYIDWYRGLPLQDGEKIQIPILQRENQYKISNLEILNDPREASYNAKKPSYFSIWDGKYKFPIINPQRFKFSPIDEIIDMQPNYTLTCINSRPNYSCWFEFFEIPELNNTNEDLKQHLFESAREWIRLGVDGFRLDIPDMLNEAHQFWAEFRETVNNELKKIGKRPQDFYILGEIWTNDEITNSFLNSNENAYPKRFDAIMNYPIRESVINFLSGEILEPKSDRVCTADDISVSELDEILHKNFENISFNTDRVQFNCFSSHDTRRLRSIFPDIKKLKTAITMQFTLIGAPSIYYGDEIGLKGGIDPDNRACMDWDLIENIEDYPLEKTIWEHYKMLINLRQTRKALRQGVMLTLLVDNEKEIYAYARFANNGDCVIVVISRNSIDTPIYIDLSDTPFEYTQKWKNAFDNTEITLKDTYLVIEPNKMLNNHVILLN